MSSKNVSTFKKWWGGDSVKLAYIAEVLSKNRYRESKTTLKGSSIVPNVKDGGGSIIVWEAYANCKVRDLRLVKSELNQTGYQSVLQNHAILSGTRLVGQAFVLVRDNEPKHTNKHFQRNTKSKEEQLVLPLMSWAGLSADLNPIELVWDEVDRKIRAKQPTSATCLWQL